ncbi:MAG: discoidin domain-containing protein, partial [Clostridia bacterium]|nr:discoidin domain-containing protein [Clostridia bacterium]
MKSKTRLLVATLAVIFLVCTSFVIAYAETDTASVLLSELKGICPTFSEDGEKIVLPEASDDNYEVLLYGTSNESVIGSDGSVYTPLVDTDVELMYKVVNKNDGNDFAVSVSSDCVLTVKGLHTVETGDNEEPSVLPKLREWKGLSGTLSLTAESRVCYSDEKLAKTAALIAEYISGVTELEISAYLSESAVYGDIVLTVSEEAELGAEGYRIAIEDTVNISAPYANGLLYGGTTVSQMLALDGDCELPRGYVRDYPTVSVRSLMIDVARAYIPLDYVEEITKYMAYFKLNEIRLHINDNGGEQDYAFRLESKLYPEINSNLPSDEIYTQEAYRAFRKNALDYGVTVITEIDTPAHSGFVKLYDESLMLDKSHIDLSGDNYDRSIAFVQSLINEFVDGDDPVIGAKRVHIGMDEYGSNRTAFLNYMKDMTDYMVEKGITPAIWGAIKAADVSQGAVLPNPESVINCWSGSEASYPDVVKAGYNVINNSCMSLYIVPGGFSSSFFDRMNIADIYESFEVNRLGGYEISIAHPQLLGIEASLWNDKDGGMSKYDLFDRMCAQIAIVSEKGWFGKGTGKDGAAFESRYRALEYTSPVSNPSRHVDTGDSDVVIDTDFSSENGFTLFGNAVLSEKDGTSVLLLNKDGYISLPYKSVGYPYTLKISINYSARTAASAPLFAGEEGTLYLNYKGSGCIAYERQGRIYILDYELESDVWHELIIVCDGDACRLYSRGVQLAEGKYYGESTDNMRSSTFVLPTERIGEGVVGAIGELKIINSALDHNEITGLDLLGYGNVALGSAVTLSGIETGVNCTPEMAVDGIESGSANRISLNRVDDAWFTVDLGKVCNIDRIDIIWQKRPNKYRVLVSEDGVNWTSVYENLNCAGASAGTDSINIDGGTRAKYIKYQQIQKFATAQGYTYSGAFFEIKAYGYSLFGYENIAHGKTVTLSGIESGVNCTPEMAVDGIESGSGNANRISLNRVDNAWFTVDLGRTCDIEAIDIIWQKRPNKYSILVSVDGVEWTKVYEDLECVGASKGTDTIPIGGTKARYVKYQQIQKFATAQGYTYSGAFYEVKIYGSSAPSYTNVALGKDVTLSGTEWGVNCTPEMAVDGISEIISANRISLNKVDDAWFTVDLGGYYNIDLIEMVWYKRPNKYSMLVSEDGVNWTSVYENLNCVGASAGTDEITVPGGIKARYMKYQQIEMFVGNAEKNLRYSGNFTEIRVFGDKAYNNFALSKIFGIIGNADISDADHTFVERLKQSYGLLEYLLENGSKRTVALALRALSSEAEKYYSGNYAFTNTDVSGILNKLENKLPEGKYSERSFNRYETAYALAISAAIDSSLTDVEVEGALLELTSAINKLVPTAIDELDFAPQTSILLGSELVYNVYVPAVEVLKSYTVNGLTYEDAEIVTLDDGKSYYHVKVAMPASEAARDIVLKVILTIDGKDYTGSFTMSIPSYAKKIIEMNPSEAEVTLVKDVLAYIRAAYVYFNAADKDEAIAVIDEVLGTYESEFAKVEGNTNTA